MSRVAGVGSRGWFFLSDFGRSVVCFGTCAEAEAVIASLEGKPLGATGSSP
ncbi:MAG: hypothetical protein RL230_2782, partial [Pseudomonadota bacterium]